MHDERLRSSDLQEVWEALGEIETPAPRTSTGEAYRRLLRALGPARRPFPRTLAAAAAIIAVVAGGLLGQILVDGGDEGARATVLVEDAEAVTIRVALGDVLVRAHDASFARVESRGIGGEGPRSPSVESEDGRVRVEHPDPGSAVDLVVTVPVRAEVLLDLGRGQVRLDGLAGHTAVFVRRGDVTGTLRPSGEPVTLSTRVGNVDVTVPAGTRADLLIFCPRGEVETDFALFWNGGPLGGGGAPFELLVADGNCTLRKS